MNPIEDYTEAEEVVDANQHYLLPKHPFRLLIAGASGTGKTNLLLNFIYDYLEFYNLFIFAKDIYEPKYAKLKEKYTMFDDVDIGQMLVKYPKKKKKIVRELFEKFGKKGSMFSSDTKEFITVDDLDPSFKNVVVFDDCMTDKDQKSIDDFFIRGVTKKSCPEKVYYDPETGFCGMRELSRKTGLSRKEVSEFLHQQDVYTKHKPLICKFKRRRTYVSHIDDQWQADLLFLKPLSRYNDGKNYLLTVIDIFSKYAWAEPISRKTGEEVTKAFKKIFKERIPEKMQTDKGTEFINKETQKLFKENTIHWFTSENVEIKCSIVERFNRTLNGKIRKYLAANNTNRYIDVLDQLVKNYNNSYHRSIKMTPVEASQEENSDKVYQNLFK
ncbi:Putative uncharacterized transposon-derived protein F54H12.3 [Araneus ventricosus]|uniref:Uncharacterized transposon-derived protein F54H12.3 n=1 Tax=Araneus ventricosus TaxID=182803 RepID=A0A4Y2TSI4_ARAVE|nr:Putative uncharacterized transposon-derived protein F54H12.3 [Araneus ventricosus]